VPEAGALVVPDIAAMMTLPVNAGQGFTNADYGNIDLVQGTKAYQAFVNSLALGHTVEHAVQDANNRLAQDYPNYNAPRLPQVIFMSVGTQDVCPDCQR
jgi:hypothetical protein